MHSVKWVRRFNNLCTHFVLYQGRSVNIVYYDAFDMTFLLFLRIKIKILKKNMETLGYFAGILTTIAFVPQVLQIYKTKSAKDVSLAMFLMFTFGVFLWLIYGIEANALPVIIANSITLLLSMVILFFKFKYREIPQV